MLRNRNKTLSIVFIYLLIINISSFSQSVGTIADSLRKKSLTSLAAGDLKQSLIYYDDLFSTTYEEDSEILENICLKVIKEVHTSPDTDFKLSSLNLLEKVINVPLGRTICVFFNDNDEEVRNLAVNILVKYNNDLLFPEISSNLQSSNLFSVVSALEFIKKIKSKFFVEVVTKLLDHDDIFIKGLAVETIASINPESDEITKKLEELITHSSAKIRASTVKALTIMQADPEKFNEVIKDNDIDVQLALLNWAKQNSGSLADRIIRQNLQAKNQNIYAAACRAALESEKMRKRVQWDKLIKNPDSRLRHLALKALIKANEFFDDEDIAYNFLNDNDKNVREEAAKAVLKAEDKMLSDSLMDIVISQLDENVIDAFISIWIANPDLPCDPKFLNEILNLKNDYVLSKSIPLISRLSDNDQFLLKEKIFESTIYSVQENFFNYIYNNSITVLASENIDKGIESKSVRVKSSAIKCLSLLEGFNVSQLDEYYESKFWLIRKSCLMALEKSDLEIKMQWITKCMQDTSGEVRLQTLKLASTIEEKESVTNIFVDALFDQYESVRRYALEYLENPEVKKEDKKEEDKKEEDKKEEDKKEEDKKEEDKKEKPKKKLSQNSKLMSWLKTGKKNKNKDKVSFKREGNNSISPLNVDDNNNQKKQNLQKKLNKLLQESKDKNTKTKAQVFLMEMGDEDSLKNIKNRLEDKSTENRKDAAEKLGYLRDTAVIPVLREQLKNETELEVKFELAFAIWKILPYLD